MRKHHHLLCILSRSLSLFFFFASSFFSLSFHGVLSNFSAICDPDSPPFLCGHVQIRYPFWNVSDDAPVHCGYLGLGIACPYGSRHPILSLQGDNYFVTDINYDNETLTLVDVDIAIAGQECPRVSHNLTLGSLPLAYNSANAILTFLFNCTTPVARIPADLVAVDCLRSGDNQSYVFVNKSLEEVAAFDKELDCEDTEVAPVKRTNVTAGNVAEEFAGAMNEGFVLDWEKAKDCGECEHSGGRCAVDEEEQLLCYCDDESIHYDGSFCKRNKKIGLKVGIGVVALVAGIGVILILLLPFRKKPMTRIIMASIKQRSKHFDGEMKIEGLVFSRRYTYKDIKRMTNSFKEKLGQGGYGCVYKGKLRDGQLVAVKLLKKLKGDAEEFFNEVASISRTSHVNVVSLLGFCFEGSKRALVYEFMPNGSLEKFIFNRSDTLEVGRQLTWETLYQVSLGIAYGLEYLHRGCNTRILHFDIKPHNILLDANYCPKISDFGLAKICPREESIVSMLGARGTPGYIAPELIVRNIGGISHKSDVYSYGMMILEMVGKRKNIEAAVDHTSEIYFPHWVHQRLELQEELGLHGITNEDDEGIAKKMIVTGLWCIQIDPRARPSMTQVVEMLKGSVEALQIPPKPSLSSPSRSFAACPRELSSLQESNDSSWGYARSILRNQHSL
ncbi:LEAF RUST 10 DISEASE-RESISTANCE LOCUS RECEPTOR-LIKE PROTEIN KINASE-like 2.1 isoform X1 [Rhodamnia argentea]|uniref:non-specific serine/threonine protein kinase n=1 Tax=Rhodamnia argentea TaxID=178133 RepID=A0ABM3HJS6_9MYRT|nr:LEAF RUST 10 DISEASE-RESISTANCE LOCUS RECEPTOR-LIKE PROTEIN KINASE-like 2.1 isoform X1 [Rhodamnia argentea]